MFHILFSASLVYSSSGFIPEFCRDYLSLDILFINILMEIYLFPLDIETTANTSSEISTGLRCCSCCGLAINSCYFQNYFIKSASSMIRDRDLFSINQRGLQLF